MSAQSGNSTSVVGIVVALLGAGAAIFLHGTWIYAVVGVVLIVAFLLFLAGLKIAKHRVLSQSEKRELRASLDAQGFTKEVRTQQRKSGRFGLAVLLGMFLFAVLFYPSTYFLIQQNVSFAVRLALDVLLVLAVIPLSIALSNAIARGLSAWVKPLDEWLN
jgi:hypothetical protein